MLLEGGAKTRIALQKCESCFLLSTVEVLRAVKQKYMVGMFTCIKKCLSSFVHLLFICCSYNVFTDKKSFLF